MRILGIDPGYAETGWGVVETDGQHRRPVSYGVIRTTPDMADQMRIHTIANAIGQLVIDQKIDVCGMEDIFFTKNISSAISVAKVIGAACHQLALQQIPARLFSPMTIKQTITGVGSADKNQVQQMVRILLGLPAIPKPDHAADALAAALCLATFVATDDQMGRPKP
ncbi:MAG: crossover junction endodeoxyribonuclease RuvC [Sphaerochaeta sp.]|jgi:crossover junction endodeoxyribonuclease RuvC|nr:crossover junction endodeoxyribonuclease RuvC [Sphaerochaeta sp.]MCH3920725.1 crossover junction endodeoxyribonuclease RuvC [Sphaerochaeta sp.]MCI2077043.1 crossover junction endodeoxyribonuclease RuvC [Sphaerochaeta sp.]MCI2096490.1 crossover junction endodeoxyribonuclease RuvC [Sphaerochaeta sp.]MCI2104413.1 crossover junction endodeoxyribonuclease RuvC [Sphaerochaeta sp.]